MTDSLFRLLGAAAAHLVIGTLTGIGLVIGFTIMGIDL